MRSQSRPKSSSIPIGPRRGSAEMNLIPASTSSSWQAAALNISWSVARHPNPAIIGPRVELPETPGVFGEELKGVLRALTHHSKHRLPPVGRNPITKQISHAGNEYFYWPSLVCRFPYPVRPEVRGEPDLWRVEPPGHVPGVAVRAPMPAASHRVPCKISPFDGCPIHPEPQCPLFPKLTPALPLPCSRIVYLPIPTYIS